MPIQLYNSGKRQIHGETHVKFTTDENGKRTYGLDKDGKEIKPKAFVLHPKCALEFDDVTGAKLQKLYAGEVVSFEDLKQKNFGAAKSADDAAPVEATLHQNDRTPKLSLNELSPEEQAAIALMRTQNAAPAESTAAEAEADDMDKSEVVEDAKADAGAPEKAKGGLLSKITDALSKDKGAA